MTINFNHENRQKSKKDDENPKRLEGGFEMAAEPGDLILCFPQIFIAFGLSCLIFLIALLLWILAGYYSFTIWVTCLTIALGLCAFLPEYFCHLIGMAIEFALWVAYTLFTMARWFQILYLKYQVEKTHLTGWDWPFALTCIAIQFMCAALIAFILLRIVMMLYRNR